ncbi:MAG: hypothetical protein U0599_13160 [Vicinamibacteria bacterium]
MPRPPQPIAPIVTFEFASVPKAVFGETSRGPLARAAAARNSRRVDWSAGATPSPPAGWFFSCSLMALPPSSMGGPGARRERPPGPPSGRYHAGRPGRRAGGAIGAAGRWSSVDDSMADTDALYRVPLCADFVRDRDALAARLKAAGDKGARPR